MNDKECIHGTMLHISKCMRCEELKINNLGCFLDRAYCASPKCKNECGRKMSEEVKEAISKIENCRVAYAYFCAQEY